MSSFRVLVPIKRVVDYAVKVRVAAGSVDINGAKMAVNPFDEIAAEEAVRLKDSGVASEVVAVSIGPKQCVDQLRTALAMGADRAIHVETDMRADVDLQPLAVSKILAYVAKKNDVSLVVVGKQAIDDDYNQTGQLLSAQLGWSQGTFISSLKVDKTSNSATAVREIDGGSQTISLTLPAVVTTDLRLNTPRYATLPNIMKAKKKPLETIKLEDLKLDVAPRLKLIKVEEPSVRKAGVKVESVADLVDKLKNTAKII